MIVYNWKAEFSRRELERIGQCQDVVYSEGMSDMNLIKHLIKEMANALDRYEVILNEMERVQAHYEEC